MQSGIAAPNNSPSTSELSLQSKLMAFGRWMVRTQEGVLFLIVLLLCIFLSLRSPVFLTQRNISVLLSQISMTAISAVGMTLLLIAGEVDLSVGSAQAFIGVLVMQVLNQTQNLALGLMAGLGLGAILGMVNSVATLGLGINSFIVTLAMLSIVRGLAYAFTNAAVQNAHNLPEFAAIGNGFIGMVPTPVAVFIVVFIVFYLILSRTSFGRYIQIVGGNRRAATLSGVRVNLIKILCFIIASLLASVSAMILLSRLNSGQNNAGFGFELQVVGAALLGGTSLQGGRGSLFGTLLAVLVLGILNNGIILLGINSSWQIAVNGLLILTAVLLDARRRRRTGGD